MKNLIFASLLIFSQTIQLNAASEDDSVVVQLETEGRLLPTYLAPIKPGAFDLAYTGKLETVLRFDLSNNGTMKVTRNSPDLDAISNEKEIAKPANLPTWRAAEMYYVVNATIDSARKLSAKVIAVNGATMKRVDNIPLTGDLNRDRQQIHKVADAIHKALFGTEGIASKRLLYTSKTVHTKDHEISEVYESDYDGANVRQLTHEKALCVSPFYLPPAPGRKPGTFFYVSYAPGIPKIFAAPLANGDGQRIITLRGNQLLPTISKQRDQLAFISDASGNPDLFLAPFDPEEGQTEKPRQIYSIPHATQGSPTFSPDGTKVAFVSNKDGRARIYVMDIPEPGAKIRSIKPEMITKANRECTAPQWSPDGKKLVYQSRIEKHRQILTYDFFTGEEKQLTTGPTDKENPAWAPNSMHIAYNSRGQIYMINTTNPVPVQVTTGPGEKHFPAWEPGS